MFTSQRSEKKILLKYIYKENRLQNRLFSTICILYFATIKLNMFRILIRFISNILISRGKSLCGHCVIAEIAINLILFEKINGNYFHLYGNKICNNLRFIFSFPEFPLILLNTLFYHIIPYFLSKPF